MPKTMLLPVQITDTEKLVILGEVSLALTEVEKLEAEKKRLPEAIKTLLGSIHLKNHALAAGVIERDVEIREEPNAFAAKVKVFRVDTGELVKERNMDPEEAQLLLGNSSVPGPTPDNVRSLAEAREKTEEQLAAGTPEEAELIRQQRLAAEAAERGEVTIEHLMTLAKVEARGPEGFVAHVPQAPGLASGHVGPIRGTELEALDELRSELERLMDGTAPTEADARAAEIEQLEEQQKADDTKTKPKRGLKVPDGAKSRRTKKPTGAADDDLAF